jgi:hypothetical protein
VRDRIIDCIEVYDLVDDKRYPYLGVWFSINPAETYMAGLKVSEGTIEMDSLGKTAELYHFIPAPMWIGKA